MGSILTVAVLWVLLLNPFWISVLILFFTSSSWSLVNRNSSSVSAIWRVWSANREAQAVTIAAPLPLPLSESKKRTSDSGTRRRTVLCNRRAYLRETEGCGFKCHSVYYCVAFWPTLSVGYVVSPVGGDKRLAFWVIYWTIHLTDSFKTNHSGLSLWASQWIIYSNDSLNDSFRNKAAPLCCSETLNWPCMERYSLKKQWLS